MNALTTFRALTINEPGLVTGIYNKTWFTDKNQYVEKHYIICNNISYTINPESLAIYTGINDVNKNPIFASLEIDGVMTTGGDIFTFDKLNQIKLNDFETVKMKGYFVYNSDMLRFEIKPIDVNFDYNIIYDLGTTNLKLLK
jgi:hypothetical protein